MKVLLVLIAAAVALALKGSAGAAATGAQPAAVKGAALSGAAAVDQLPPAETTESQRLAERRALVQVDHIYRPPKTAPVFTDLGKAGQLDAGSASDVKNATKGAGAGIGAIFGDPEAGAKIGEKVGAVLVPVIDALGLGGGNAAGLSPQQLAYVNAGATQSERVARARQVENASGTKRLIIGTDAQGRPIYGEVGGTEGLEAGTGYGGTPMRAQYNPETGEIENVVTWSGVLAQSAGEE